MANTEIEFQVRKHIGVITDYATGWAKEINIVSWNGGAPKVDIRDWSPDHEHMSRGITLTEAEFTKAVNLVKERAPEIIEKGTKARDDFEMGR